MVQLIVVTYNAQHLDGLFQRWFVDHHRLEAALQRGILFNMFAVLIQSCGADTAQLATSKRRLEHIGSSNSALRGSCANHRVQFIDTDDGIIRLAPFFAYCFATLL